MQQVEHNWNTKLYNDKHSFVYDYGMSLVDLLHPKYDERILDLGCGSGELTKRISELAKDVIGVDKSQEMIAEASSRFPLIQFQVGDAGGFSFKKPFDAIFSNATLHWVLNYKEAIRSMYHNLNYGGRLVIEFGGKDNVKAITNQLRLSLAKRGYIRQSELILWYFPSIGKYTAELEAAGFEISFAQWYDRPTALTSDNTGIKDWLIMFSKPFFEDVKDSHIELIMDEVQESLKPILFKKGKWYADYKRIRIVAHKQKLTKKTQ